MISAAARLAATSSPRTIVGTLHFAGSWPVHVRAVCGGIHPSAPADYRVVIWLLAADNVARSSATTGSI